MGLQEGRCCSPLFFWSAIFQVPAPRSLNFRSKDNETNGVAETHLDGRGYGGWNHDKYLTEMRGTQKQMQNLKVLSGPCSPIKINICAFILREKLSIHLLMHFLFHLRHSIMTAPEYNPSIVKSFNPFVFQLLLLILFLLNANFVVSLPKDLQ